MQITTAKTYIATIISRTFDIYVVFPIIIFITYILSIQQTTSLIWASIFFVALVIIPVAGDLFLLATKQIKDWDLSVRKDRVKYIDMEVFLLLIIFIATNIYATPLYFRMLAFMLFFIELTYALITPFWKISIHAQLITLLSLYTIVLVNKAFIPMLLLIPCVFFARLQLKKHTFMQLCIGTLLCTTIVVFSFFVFLH